MCFKYMYMYCNSVLCLPWLASRRLCVVLKRNLSMVVWSISSHVSVCLRLLYCIVFFFIFSDHVILVCFSTVSCECYEPYSLGTDTPVTCNVHTVNGVSCQHGGTGELLADGTVRCWCTSEYIGDNCETRKLALVQPFLQQSHIS